MQSMCRYSSVVQHRTISTEHAAPALQLPHGGQKQSFQQMHMGFSVNACGLDAEAMHCVVAFMGPEHIFYADPYLVLGSGTFPSQADPARPLTHLSLLAFPRLLSPLIFSQGSHLSDTPRPAYLSQPCEIFSLPACSDLSALSSLGAVSELSALSLATALSRLSAFLLFAAISALLVSSPLAVLSYTSHCITKQG